MIDSFDGNNRFLSNFFPCEGGIRIGNLKAPTVEHAYQAAKTVDDDERKRIINLSTPGQAKRAGRKVTLRKDWEEIKLDVMKDLLKQKFEDDKLADLLVKTAPHELVEGNSWGDTFWGVCNGEGKNHLGKLLMETRSAIMARKEKTMTKCQGIRKDGKACNNKVAGKQPYCHHHGDQGITQSTASINDRNRKEQLMEMVRARPVQVAIINPRGEVVRRIITNRYRDVKVPKGHKLVMLPIGDDYHFVFLETELADTPYSLEIVPLKNTKEWRVIRDRKAALAWPDSDGLTALYLEEYKYWGGLKEAVGLDIEPDAKILKRLKEITRVSRYFRRFSAGELNIKVFSAAEKVEEMYGLMGPDDPRTTPEEYDKLVDEVTKTYDGKWIIRKDLLRSMGVPRNSEGIPLSGNSRLIGVGKANYISSLDDDRSRPHIETIDDNLKRGLSFDDGHCILSLHPQHEHHEALTSVQILSWMNKMFPQKHLIDALRVKSSEAIMAIENNELPRYMTEEHYDTAIQSDIQFWLNKGRDIKEMGPWLYLAMNQFRLKYKGARFPIPHGVYAYVGTREMLIDAGEKSENLPTNTFYHKKTGLMTLPGKLFAERYDAHGGWDLDDSAIFMLRKFKEDGVKLVIVRSPNFWGEYSIVDVDVDSVKEVMYNAVDEFGDDLKIPKTKMTVKKFEKLVPPNSVVNLNTNFTSNPSTLPKLSDEVDMDDGFTKKFAKHMHDVLLGASNIGGYANIFMVNDATHGEPLLKRPMEHERAVDTMMQEQTAAGLALIKGFMSDHWNSVAYVDPYFGLNCERRSRNRIPERVLERLDLDYTEEDKADSYLYQLGLAKQRVFNDHSESAKRMSNQLVVPIPEFDPESGIYSKIAWDRRDRKKTHELFKLAKDAIGRYEKHFANRPYGKTKEFESIGSYEGFAQVHKMVEQRADREWLHALTDKMLRWIFEQKNPEKVMTAIVRYHLQELEWQRKTLHAARVLIAPNAHDKFVISVNGEYSIVQGTPTTVKGEPAINVEGEVTVVDFKPFWATPAGWMIHIIEKHMGTTPQVLDVKLVEQILGILD